MPLGKIDNDERESNSHLNIVGLVGSIEYELSPDMVIHC